MVKCADEWVVRPEHGANVGPEPLRPLVFISRLVPQQNIATKMDTPPDRNIGAAWLLHALPLAPSWPRFHGSLDGGSPRASSSFMQLVGSSRRSPQYPQYPQGRNSVVPRVVSWLLHGSRAWWVRRGVEACGAVASSFFHMLERKVLRRKQKNEKND